MRLSLIRGAAPLLPRARTSRFRAVWTLPSLIFIGISAVVFLGMIGFLLLGRQVAARRAARPDEGSAEGTGTVEASLFALLGLLVAFSFSGAEDRLDARRAMIVDEANAIGTAYLRMDLLPEAER